MAANNDTKFELKEIDKEKQTQGKLDNETKHVEDKLTEAIGDVGRWQILIFILMVIPLKMTSTWVNMDIIFLAPKTSFQCLYTNLTDKVENNTCYKDCAKYVYHSAFDSSIISDWDLVCERGWMESFTQTLCMFGTLVGSVMYGFLADRYGRRPALLIACMTHLITRFVIPYSPEYWSFTVFRFILGTSNAGLLVTSFVLMMEIIGNNKRESVAALYHIPLAVAEIVMGIFAYYLRNWGSLSLGLAIPDLLFLSYFFLIPESPRWLLTMERIDDANEVMTTAAKWNRYPTENMLEKANKIAAEMKQENKSKTTKASYVDLLVMPSLRVKHFGCCMVWFILGLGFYGGNQYIGQTSPNSFLTVVMAGAAQIPGMLLSGYFCNYFGRRRALIIFLVISGIMNGVLAIPDDWFIIKLIAGSVAVSCGAAAFSTIYMFTTELFPTVVRNMAMGAASTTSRVGSMLAPFVAGLKSEAVWAAPLVFGVSPIIAAVICLCLPETKGKKMEDHIEEQTDR